MKIGQCGSCKEFLLLNSSYICVLCQYRLTKEWEATLKASIAYEEKLKLYLYIDNWDREHNS